MPFASQKQRRYLHMAEPAIANRWEREAKREHTPPVRKSKKSRKKATKGRKRS